VSAARKGDLIGLGAMASAGFRAVSEYTGMVLGLFAVQAVMALGAGLVIARLLAAVFATRPVFDDAVDGDLVALFAVVRNADILGAATLWIAVGAVLTWVVLSWFLGGGALAVLTERPRGRRETARCFGAGGAGTYFAFLRIGLASGIAHIALVLPAAIVGVSAVADRLERALTLMDLLGSMVLALLPAALLAAIIGAVMDYARAELTLRRPTHDHLGAAHAISRALVFVVRRPVAIGHVLLGWLAAAAVTGVYGWAAHGHPMYGPGGAVALLVIRQGLSLVRMAIEVAVLGGQVELGQTRPPPPRRVVESTD